MGLRVAALIAPIALFAVACSGAPTEIAPRATPVDTRHCADVVAQAFTSPAKPVDGVMQCFTSSLIDMANQSGVYDDRDFMSSIAAQPPVYTAETYCGRDHGGEYVYSMTSSDSTVPGSRLALAVDRTSGLVAGINTNDGDGCPKGLHQ